MSQTTTRTALADQAKAIAFILESELGGSVDLYDSTSGMKLLNVGSSKAAMLTPQEVFDGAKLQRPTVTVNGEKGYRAVLPLKEGNSVRLVAAATLARFARTAEDTQEEIRRLEKLSLLLVDKLTATCDRGQARTEINQREKEACAVIAALEVLLRTGRLHGDRPQFQRHLLKAISGVLGVRSVIWVPSDTAAEVVSRGEHGLSAWDCRQLAARLSERDDWDPAGVLIDNEVQHTELAEKLPTVTSLLVVRVKEEPTSGYVIVFNKCTKQTGKDGEAHDLPVEFRRSDAALLVSFTTLLAAQARTSLRHEEMKGFAVGLTKSLTAAIDAKDAYTFGHSERVARISVELAKELGLAADEVSDIYLAGLLHDIGKIGIRDSVLGKPGKLTDEEREHINQHPKIGYRILSGLGAIKHLLGGVLYHHERYDGGGYPDGLLGEKIPQLARIIAVADSYDAMSADRPYRAGMPQEKVEAIIQEGSGTQWDPIVVDAFSRCKQKVREIRQRGVGESLRNALDGAMRQTPVLEQSMNFAVTAR